MTIPELAWKAAHDVVKDTRNVGSVIRIEVVIESALNELAAQKDEEYADARKDSGRLEWLANHARIEAPRMSAITQKDLRAAIDAARNQQP